MLFTQLEFLFFFAVVLLMTWAMRSKGSRHFVLLSASYYFYAYWDIRFCGLILFSTVVDYFVAKKIGAVRGERHKRYLLGLSLVVNLGLLAFFKYFNFFIESAAPLLESLGLGTSSLSIILPVGISFYTFQTLSYTIDVYRGVIKPIDRWIDFALYVSFFPQLVAGPIVRASEFLPQLDRVPIWSHRRFYAGFQQMLRGAIKKVILADRLAEMVDVVFAGPDLYSGVTLWIAALAYAGQIYYDFSGYSDLAIGAAKMLGYRFPVNFRHPYLATSLTEFWRRWHMTLSRWLRDYLYISLGGNRLGSRRTYLNLSLTMLLGGLWHGAAWNFVLWGGLHGLGLSIERCLRSGGIRSRQSDPADSSPIRMDSQRQAIVGVNTLFMGLVVLIGWILFRSATLSDAIFYLHRMLSFSEGIGWFPPLAIAALSCLIAEHLLWKTRIRKVMRLPFDAWYSPTLTVVMIWVLLLYPPTGFRPFVYFQF
ncbi:MAG: MBOAT family O-acyltransferase [Rubripirellula sp.]